MNPQFKVLGVNDDKDFCECCGKSRLSRVVWIENLETGKIQHFGVVCAENPSKAFGLKKEIRSASYAFKQILNARYAAAGGLYRKKGGGYVNGDEPYSIKPADQPLYELCLTEISL